MNVKVVIGANFGDEGKGRVTDFFCKNVTGSCINVLNNGGAQRGHTVYKDFTNCHIFHHFGSGTFRNVPTYCSRDFIVNPMTFTKEYAELENIGACPKLYYNALCRWSTPFDMLVNQIVEEFRGDKKHGSCGMGIWETVSRYDIGKLLPAISIFNLYSYEEKVNTLKSLRDVYYINRLKETYNIKDVPNNWKNIFYSQTLIDNFIVDVSFFCNNAIAIWNTDKMFLNHFENVVIENGQGLLLDQSRESFYGNNLTPSYTGAINVINLIPDSANVELCYVTRSYMTRHGAGKFETENNNLIVPDKYETNKTNEFQDNFRYGELIVPNLINRVNADAKLVEDKLNITKTIAITHTDELDLEIDGFKNYKFNSYIS